MEHFVAEFVLILPSMILNVNFGFILKFHLSRLGIFFKENLKQICVLQVTEKTKNA